MMIALPEIAFVLVHGASHEAAMTLAHRLFARDEILDMSAPRDVLFAALDARTRAGLLTVVVEAGAPVGAHKLRVALASLARNNYVRRFALVMPDVHESEPGMVERLRADGYREVVPLSAADTYGAGICRERMPTDLRDEHGPFDIIGDVHGCAGELEELLVRLGYRVALEGEGERRTATVTPPRGRRVIFVGDLVDRGPRAADALRIVMSMVSSGTALLVPGNHDVKFLRWLEGEKVSVTHGLDVTIRDVERESQAFRDGVRMMLKSLWSHVWVDGGALAVAHAGIKELMIGRATPRVRRFCLYGDTSGERDERGLPVRYHWALDYRGEVAIVYGHTPVAEVAWVNNTLCVDTGSCFGGKLTALRWPERQVVSVEALETYAQRMRPFGHPPARPA